MIIDILPEIQEFLLSHQIISEKNIHFYALWVSKYIFLLNWNRDITKERAQNVKQIVEKLKEKGRNDLL